MQVVVLSIHLLVCICLIGLVLLQRSEGGALGMGGGGGGSLMSGRGAGDALARMTQIAGAFFLATSFLLTFLSGAASTGDRSLFDMLPRLEHAAPPPAPVQTAPAPSPSTDPTQGAAPEAAQSQLASLTTTPEQTPAIAGPVAPPPAAAATRAGPLDSHPAVASPPASQRGATTVPVSTTNTAPAHTTPAPQRSEGATTQPAATRQPPVRPLILPNTSGAGTNSLTQPDAESVEVSNGVEAVRRERAGPDQ
jgi:preprotein translocase subunit SecG